METIEQPQAAETPIKMSVAAVEKIKGLMQEENEPGLKLRVFVQGGGCSGFQYGFTFENQGAEDDMALDFQGVGVLVDSMSLQYLSGAEIDYAEDINGAQFLIKNPKASTTCGCGSSFSV